VDQVERPQCGVSAGAQVLFADWGALPFSHRALSDQGQLPTYRLSIAKVLATDEDQARCRWHLRIIRGYLQLLQREKSLAFANCRRCSQLLRSKMPLAFANYYTAFAIIAKQNAIGICKCSVPSVIIEKQNAIGICKLLGIICNYCNTKCHWHLQIVGDCLKIIATQNAIGICKMVGAICNYCAAKCRCYSQIVTCHLQLLQSKMQIIEDCLQLLQRKMPLAFASYQCHP